MKKLKNFFLIFFFVVLVLVGSGVIVFVGLAGKNYYLRVPIFVTVFFRVRVSDVSLQVGRLRKVPTANFAMKRPGDSQRTNS